MRPIAARDSSLAILTLLAMTFSVPALAGGDDPKPACARSVVAPTGCDPITSLEDHLRKAKTPEGTFVLTLDHCQPPGWWEGFRWDGRRLDLLEERYFDLQPEDRPRLNLAKNADLEVYVVNTNPLIYTLSTGASSVADRDDLANLQKLTGLLAGQLSSVLEGTRQFDPELTERTLESLRVDSQSCPEEIERTLGKLQYKVDRKRITLTASLAALAEKTHALQQNLDAHKTRMRSLESYLRSLELGEPMTSPLESSPFRDPESAFAEIYTAAQALGDEDSACKEGLLQLARSLELKVDGLRGDSGHQLENSRRKAEYAELTLKLIGTEHCPDLGEALREVGRWLQGNPLRTAPEPCADPLSSLEWHARQYLALLEERAKIVKTAIELQGERGAVVAQNQQISILRQRQDDSLGDRPSRCMLRYGVIPVVRFQGKKVDVKWSEIRTESFKISFDQTFKNMVIPVRPTSLEAKYELERTFWWQNFDIDFGVVYTDLVEPEFSAVSVPKSEGGEMSMPEAEMEDLKVISVADEESRAGDVALFATWVPVNRKSFHFGPQIGLGLDTDTPQLFAGLAFGFGRYVKISGGWTWQEVTELARGQTVDMTLVESDDDIKTRKGFDDDWYVALTISIDNLPFWREE